MLSENENINALYYNKTASKYETTGRINEAGNRARIKRLLSSLIIREDFKILDVCCGAGLYLSILKNFVRSENLSGLDISKEMLKISSAFCKQVHLGSVYSIPFSNETFDLVTCSSALHHLDNLSTALEEILRVLKPGGLFLSDYDNNVHFAKYDSWKNRLVKLLLVYPLILKAIKKIRSPSEGEKPPHAKPLNELSLDELHRLAEAQNYHSDGINAFHLKKILKNVGFRQVQIFTYHSGRWNDGVHFNLLTSLANNKIYTVSKK